MSIMSVLSISGFLVSKETVILGRGRVKQKFGFIKQVDKD